MALPTDALSQCVKPSVWNILDSQTWSFQNFSLSVNDSEYDTIEKPKECGWVLMQYPRIRNVSILGLFDPYYYRAVKENTHLSGGARRRSLAGIRRRMPMPDASKWSPDSHHPTSVCFPFIPYFFCFFEEQEVKFLGQHFYYMIHHGVPCGGGSRSFLCDTLSSRNNICYICSLMGMVYAVSWQSSKL